MRAEDEFDAVGVLSPVGPGVIDFGIARALDATTMLSEAIIGTPAFMAPEQ